MYILQFAPLSYRVFKKHPLDVRNKIRNEAETLQEEPLKGEPLRGRYRGLRLLHFGYRGVQYWVIYQLLQAEQVIIIRLADKRENIYRRLEEAGL